METLTLFNGNDKRYKLDMPKIFIRDKFINDVALEHIIHNTGIKFKDTGYGYIGYPTTTKQIVKLFLTYNWRTDYYNNANTHNTLFLKSYNENDKYE